MQIAITFITYKRRYILFAFLSMIIFRISFIFNKKIDFIKLVGTGKGGGFSFWPNLRVWGILTASNSKQDEDIIINNFYSNKFYNSLITKWIDIFSISTITYILEPIEGHGKWDGKEVFGQLPIKSDYDGKIAVLTRATIHLSKLRRFWKHVKPTSTALNNMPGLIKSYGFGEVPWVKQATLSIWENKEAIKNYAYRLKEHKEVIEKTRKEKWYKEEMFVRFRIIDIIDHN